MIYLTICKYISKSIKDWSDLDCLSIGLIYSAGIAFDDVMDAKYSVSSGIFDEKAIVLSTFYPVKEAKYLRTASNP